MEIRKLLGHRVYLEFPEETHTNLAYIDPETKAALESDKLKKWGKLKVYAVGSDVSGLEEGDEVMIDPTNAKNVIKIPLSEDRTVLLISYFDIAHIW
jgi:hypothetical protein